MFFICPHCLPIWYDTNGEAMQMGHAEATRSYIQPAVSCQDSTCRPSISIAKFLCIPAVAHSTTESGLARAVARPGAMPKARIVICRESNDFLLPAMITFLNDRDWQLRAAFFHHICDMGSYAGCEGLQAFLLPCLEQVCRCCLHRHPRDCCNCRSACVQAFGPPRI